MKKNLSKGETVVALRKQHSALLNERTPWISDYRELAEHFNPRKMRALDQGDKTNEGGLNDTLLDNVSIIAMRVLAAGMQGGMTSPARPWFRLGVPDSTLEESVNVKEWLDEVGVRMRIVFSRSNFYSSMHSQYRELGVFGTNCMFMEEDFEEVVKFITLTAGEYACSQDASMTVATVFRLFELNAEQIVERFGVDNVSQTIKSAFEDPAQIDNYFKIAHAVFPNPDKRFWKEDVEGKDFISVYYEYESAEENTHFLEYEGYYEKPFTAPRWDVTGNDTYGSAPSMDVFNDVRQLQAMKATMLKTLQKEADPPMNAPSSLKDASLAPGAVNFIDTAGVKFEPAINVKPDPQKTMIAIEDVKNSIREGLYNDLFKMLALASDNDMTATEVQQRVEEKLIQLGPVLERFQSEVLDVIIDRVFGIMLRRGLLPPPPEELEGMDLKVEYISVLAQAQKMVGTASVEQFINFVMNTGNVFDEALDILDVDEATEEYAEMLGVSPKVVRSREERQQIRETRAQQQAEIAQQEAIAQASQSVKNFSAAQTDGEGASALDAITGGLVQ